MLVMNLFILLPISNSLQVNVSLSYYVCILTNGRLRLEDYLNESVLDKRHSF